VPEFKQQRVNGKFFVVWYDEQGRRHRRSLGTADRQVATAALIEFKRTYTATTSGSPVTVAEIYQAYLEDRMAEGKAAVPRIRDAWKRLSDFFGAMMPYQINEDQCREYSKGRYAAGAGPGTVHVELGYLRAAMRYAARKRRWIEHEPYVPLPRKPAPKDHHLTKDEARSLIAAAGQPHVKLFIVLALSTAGRAAAILDLTWMRIDFERRKIMLQDPEVAVTAKGRATVPMNETAYQALLEAKAGALTPYVVEWGGKKVGSVKKAVARAAARAGVTCTPHTLRHTAAVWMAEAGESMEAIAQYMGHSNVDTTRRVYARFSPDYLRRAAGALEL